jgi:hypothetical protein
MFPSLLKLVIRHLVPISSKDVCFDPSCQYVFQFAFCIASPNIGWSLHHKCSDESSVFPRSFIFCLDASFVAGFCANRPKPGLFFAPDFIRVFLIFASTTISPVVNPQANFLFHKTLLID